MTSATHRVDLNGIRHLYVKDGPLAERHYTIRLDMFGKPEITSHFTRKRRQGALVATYKAVDPRGLVGQMVLAILRETPEDMS
jgi:hypothetical protein